LDTAFATIAAVFAGKSTGVNAEHLAKVWCIPHDEAAQTLKVTTQSLQHDHDSSLSRNVGTNDRAVQFLKIKSFFFSNTLFMTGTAKSSRGNICVELFVSNKGFVAISHEKAARLLPCIEAVCKGHWSARRPGL